jgi:hypothetical protein
MMKPQRSGRIELTASQYRELHRIACAKRGHAEGKGAEWAVRSRLRAGGLVELRTISDRRTETNIWFITDAGRDLLSLTRD